MRSQKLHPTAKTNGAASGRRCVAGIRSIKPVPGITGTTISSVHFVNHHGRCVLAELNAGIGATVNGHLRSYKKPYHQGFGAFNSRAELGETVTINYMAAAAGER